ncbi:alpha/beta hydrolase family protein [Amycolatopsis nigrescens]|uniref:alpha/beta hydrolase family protein n=1 Tax=Amycolatopsis nigrescens TaxID=381445 RepID=UPI00035E148C|nr:hypothetical protein [Amycolatopsis nigrescens]
MTRFGTGGRGRLTCLMATMATMALAVAVAVPLTPAAAAQRTGGVRAQLPAPTGPHQVGTTRLHLVDHSRPDPWVPAEPARELMATVWYPTRDADRYPVAPQMPPAAAAHFETVMAEGTFAIPARIPPGTVDWAGTRTNSHLGAPPDFRGGPYPVLLYSPGHYMSRVFGTALAEEFASQGYVVVAVDHTYDPTEVEFPGGRVEVNRQPDPGSFETFKRELGIRAVDIPFVLDELARHNFGGVLDLGRVGMFGHSLGGATTAQSMHDDPRILAGVDLDGAVGTKEDPWGTVTTEGLDRPLLLFTHDGADHTDPLISELWRNLRGWRLNLQLASSAHNSFNDLSSMVPDLLAGGALTGAQATELVGTADPGDLAGDVAALRAYTRSFFDLHLRGRDDKLLAGPSPAHPGVRFVR